MTCFTCNGPDDFAIRDEIGTLIAIACAEHRDEIAEWARSEFGQVVVNDRRGMR